MHLGGGYEDAADEVEGHVLASPGLFAYALVLTQLVSSCAAGVYNEKLLKGELFFSLGAHFSI